MSPSHLIWGCPSESLILFSAISFIRFAVKYKRDLKSEQAKVKSGAEITSVSSEGAESSIEP